MRIMAKNNYQLGLYEKSMPASLSWTEKLKYAQSAGFDSLEISIDETDEKLARLDYSDEQLEEIRQAMRITNCPIQSMCLSGHRKFPLGSLDLETIDRSLEIMEKALIFANKLGIRIIQLAGYDVYYSEGSEITKSNFSENLKKAVQMAAKHGVILGFETMETDFMNTCTKAMKYVDENNSPYLGVYPDVGNLTNAARHSSLPIDKDINNASGHIFAAHLKEIIEGHYREIPFGTGDTQYDEAIKELHDQGVMRFTAEFWYKGSEQWVEDLSFANKYLREKIEKFYK